jgi:hypothetical protein
MFSCNNQDSSKPAASIDLLRVDGWVLRCSQHTLQHTLPPVNSDVTDDVPKTCTTGTYSYRQAVLQAV